MLAHPEASWLHFADRCGYVEISRSGRLEEIYFTVPKMPEGGLDKPFEEMYETEREDLDKEYQEWLHNVMLIVEKTAHDYDILNSKWGSTFTRMC